LVAAMTLTPVMTLVVTPTLTVFTPMFMSGFTTMRSAVPVVSMASVRVC
jgi:hypothetical protein